MQSVMVIGIAGGTGSGKTTITRRLMQRFGSDVCMVSYDNYYKARHDTPFEERAKINYDHPDAFDTELFLRDLRARDCVSAGRTRSLPDLVLALILLTVPHCLTLIHRDCQQ